MDFIEEKTPRGLSIKILYTKNQYLAFDKKGRSIYTDKEGTSQVHTLPLILFLGRSFHIKKDYEKSYYLLKIRKGSMVIPYTDIRDRQKKYIFIQVDKNLDMIPVLIEIVPTIQVMVKTYDAKVRPDFVIVDDEIATTDIVIIKTRYQVDDVIHAEMANNITLQARRKKKSYDDKVVNLNMLSSNPVFLARIHLRAMELSKINQLLLDFDLTALDTEYVLSFINDILINKKDDTDIVKNRAMLVSLKKAYTFYLYLLQRNDEKIEEMVQSLDDLRELAPYRTLISKAKSIFPGKDEQLLYIEYDNLLFERKEELEAGGDKEPEEAVPEGSEDGLTEEEAVWESAGPDASPESIPEDKVSSEDADIAAEHALLESIVDEELLTGGAAEEPDVLPESIAEEEAAEPDVLPESIAEEEAAEPDVLPESIAEEEAAEPDVLPESIVEEEAAEPDVLPESIIEEALLAGDESTIEDGAGSVDLGDIAEFVPDSDEGTQD
ncbi:MAG: hypothetical protein GY754_43760 [bacterium]|nr:hypothetical protein [bacterium]